MFASARELDADEVEVVAAPFARVAPARSRPSSPSGTAVQGVLSPCGRDRQVLADHYPRCRVVVPTPDGLRSVVCTDLLPGAYRASDVDDVPSDQT